MGKFTLTNSLFEAEYPSTLGGAIDMFPVYEVDNHKFAGTDYQADGQIKFRFDGGVEAAIWADDVEECTLGTDTYVREVDFNTNAELYALIVDYTKTLFAQV